MRIFRKAGSSSKAHDEEEPTGLLEDRDNDSIELLVADGQRDGSSSDDDDNANSKTAAYSKYTQRESETSSHTRQRNRYQRVGQLPSGFMSISALAREDTHNLSPETNTPEEDRDSNGTSFNATDAATAHNNSNGVNPDNFKSDLKRWLYLLMEQPSSSNAAFWTNVIVSVLIVLSALMTTIETMPAFRSSESNRVWFNLETTMVSLFTLEFLLRLFAHTDSFRVLFVFFTSPLTIIDFIAIIPFYIELIAKQDTTYEFRFTILRLLRLLRLFKSYKYSNAIVMTMEVMVVAMRRSSDALSAIVFFMATSVVLFSTLVYFAERGVWDDGLQTFVDPNGNPSPFDSIPAAIWFILVTITTTGYGDMVPVTFIGKVLTFPVMMFGVLLIALPSIIIGRNFTIVWEAMRQRQYYREMIARGGMFHTEVQSVERGAEELSETREEQAGTSSFINNLSGLHVLASGENAPDMHAFDILGGRDDSVTNQIQTLMMISQQNQEAIQRILSLLEKQHGTQSRSSAEPMRRSFHDQRQPRPFGSSVSFQEHPGFSQFATTSTSVNDTMATTLASIDETSSSSPETFHQNYKP